MDFTAPISTIQVVVLLSTFFGKGICDSTCPNGITNITGVTSGYFVYPESGTYGVNETKCWRIEIPKPYVGFGITYHTYEFEVCRSCDCDFVTIEKSYGDLDTGSKDCGRYSRNHIEYSNQVRGKAPAKSIPNNYPFSTADDLYIRIKTDDTVHYKGINISYIVESDATGSRSILNATEDETIEFSTPKFGSKNYPASFVWNWFLIVPLERQVQITFDSTFELEQSMNCENDYLEIREAYVKEPITRPVDLAGEYGAILSKPVCGTNNPGTIQSAGNMVWVHFKSDGNATTTYRGFKASFKAGQGRLSISHPMALLFLSALLMATSKDSLF